MFKISSRIGQFFLVATLLFVFGGAAAAATFNASERQTGPKRSAKGISHPGALEKQGFFNGFDGRYVNLIEEGSYRKLRYLIKDDAPILLYDQPIERVRILIHSIVKMTIVDGVVVEIIVVEESS